MVASAAPGTGWSLSRPNSSPLLSPPVTIHLGRGHRMQSLFLSAKNLRGGGDSEPERGSKILMSKILMLILNIGRVALEAYGMVTVTMTVAALLMSFWIPSDTKMKPVSTGSSTGIVLGNMMQGFFFLGMLFIFGVPAFFAASVAIYGLLTASFVAGYVEPARLVLDAAGLLSLVWSAVN